MAVTSFPQQPLEIHRLPQSKYIDSIRWLPSLSPFQKSAIIAFFDPDTCSSSLEIHSLDPSKTLTTPLSLWTPPSRISSLKSTPSSSYAFIAASTSCGSLHIFRSRENHELSSVFKPEMSVVGREFHVGSITGADLEVGGSECCCVSVGEDGRVNLVSVGVGGKNGGHKRVFDGNGLVSYTAVRWASPAEFVTGGCGLGLQWWDLRRPGAAVAQLKGNWDRGTTSGIIHSIDINPSRKHMCLAGGSSGTVFAWDLRSQQPVSLSGVGTSDGMTHSISESEVWEVQYDYCTKSSNSNISSSRILPAMFCSEDGILAGIEQGEEPTELLAEPCAINSFDIDRQNPSDVICSLEWESIAMLSRP